MSNTDQLMDKLTKAVSYQYATDKTSPGVTVSSLKKGYYCSIVRYDGAFAKGKVVVLAAKGDTLPLALKELAVKFVSLNKQLLNPIQELDELVNHNIVQ
jgi:hypothetical protein